LLLLIGRFGGRAPEGRAGAAACLS